MEAPILSRRLLSRVALAALWIIATICWYEKPRGVPLTLRTLLTTQTGGVLAATKFTPYTTVLREIVDDGRGNVREGPEYLIAQRSDGSQVHRDVSQVGTIFSRRELHFVYGDVVRINEIESRKTTLGFGSGPAIRYPQNHCLLIEQSSQSGTGLPNEGRWVGDELVSGFRSAKIQDNQGWSASFAIEFGCAMVKSYMSFGGDGSSQKHLVTLLGGEPSESLFSTPSNLQEVQPSRLRSACASCAPTPQRDSKRDNNYYSHPPKVLSR